MTGAATMVEFTPDAEHRLGEYLRQVRSALARSPGVSPEEIEADIREHIETEFHDAVAPVGLTELEAVLVRLGPPSQWVPAASTAPPAGVPAWSPGEWFRQTRRAIFGVLWRGPEDWRLPYLTFAVFALGVVAFPLFPLCLLVSYLLARAAVAAAAERGVTLGARRWLVYPPMVLVAVPLLAAALFWPFVMGAGAAHELEEAERFREWVAVGPDGSVAPAKPVAHEYVLNRVGMYRTPDGWRMPDERRAYYQVLNRVVDAFPGPRPVQYGLSIAYATAGALAAWWVVLGGLGLAFPGLPRAVFAPLASGWDARHGRRLFAAALVGLVIWGGFAYRIGTATAAAAGDPAPVVIPARTTR